MNRRDERNRVLETGLAPVGTVVGRLAFDTRLVFLGSRNAYGDNEAAWTGTDIPDWLLTCRGGIGTKNFCDLGRGNRSTGGNLLPDPM